MLPHHKRRSCAVSDRSNKARPTQILLFLSVGLTFQDVSVNYVANISKFDFFDGKPQATRLLKGSTLQRENYLQEIRTFSPWCLSKLPGGTNTDNCLLRLKLFCCSYNYFCFDLITWDPKLQKAETGKFFNTCLLSGAL